MSYDNTVNELLAKIYTVNEQLAKGKTISDIAKETETSEEQIKKQIDKGAKAEKEHTPSIDKAKQIAKDHVLEDPKYYTKLKKAGL